MARGHSKEELRSLLAETTARCVGCGYALKGVPGPFCPECGRPITALDLELGRLEPTTVQSITRSLLGAMSVAMAPAAPVRTMVLAMRLGEMSAGEAAMSILGLIAMLAPMASWLVSRSWSRARREGQWGWNAGLLAASTAAAAFGLSTMMRT